jgi:hypothetical protein
MEVVKTISMVERDVFLAYFWSSVDTMRSDLECLFGSIDTYLDNKRFWSGFSKSWLDCCFSSRRKNNRQTWLRGMNSLFIQMIKNGSQIWFILTDVKHA